MDNPKLIKVSSKEYYFTDFKDRFNLKSVIWFIFNLGILFYLSKKGFSFAGFLFNSTSALDLEEYFGVFGGLINNHPLLAIIVVIGLLIFFAVIILRFAYVVCEYILDNAIFTYGYFKSQPFPRMKYKMVKQLANSLNDKVSIGFFNAKYDSLTTPGVAIKNDFVVLSLWGYFVLTSAYYTHNLSSGLEAICHSIGISYFSKKTAKKEFKQEINKNTEKMITELLVDINKLKDTSNQYMAQGVENINNLLNK